MLLKKYETVSAEFPLEHVQMGTAVGNGYLGLSVWGSGDTVNITVGCSALWDHQGGERWRPDQSYANVCGALAARDEKRIREIFPRPSLMPSVIPLARIEVALKSARRVVLSHRDSLITAEGAENTLEIRLSQSDKGLFAIRRISGYRLIPAYELAPVLKERGFEAPRFLPDGFVQAMPCDPAFGIRGKTAADGVFFRFFRNEPCEVRAGGWRELERENRQYWSDFWEKVPELSTGDDIVDSFYYRGLFAFQCMTAADGFPAGLQGPWIEDSELPPWSSDYHFNINVEMCYWPACRAGLSGNLMPVFNMLESWKETLRLNAEYFVGIDDGYTMPHSVDDRCVNLAGFWPGTIDHTCAGWMAIMMAEYVRYSGDLEFLERFGFDFMRGTMRVYEAMLQFDGKNYVLPCETSPEFRGDAIDACGRNPSFHLAAIHRLLNELFSAADLLGRELPASWRDIQEKLPFYSECDGEIALWDGLKLPESHRHHSHLAGICPFDCGGIPDEVKKRSEQSWISHGMGNWAGWSMPWAVMLHNRFGNAEMANLLIHIWPSVFMNRGGRTLHSPVFPGFSTIWGSDRIMQMDAGLGMVAAILDLFLYEEQGVLEIFHGLPESRNSFYCKNISAPGGFRFSGDAGSFSFTAVRDAELRFRFPAGRGNWSAPDGARYAPNELVRCPLKTGETVVFHCKDVPGQEK